MSIESAQVKAPLIFVVDDDRSMRMLLHLALEQEGYRVLEVEDGQTCLDAYKYCQPDAILLDAIMPGLDGFGCCTQLRTMPGIDHTPILMITVLDDPDSVEQAFEVGATDYITKPIHWTVLRHRLRRLLQQSQLHQNLEKANRELERLACLVARDESMNFQ